MNFLTSQGADAEALAVSGSRDTITALRAENERLRAERDEALARLLDVVIADDGQAYKEARKLLERAAIPLPTPPALEEKT